jgi:selT/selW/selH-like putative selenoprotein
MDVGIEHCTVCWGYRDRALALAEALRAQFDAKVDVMDGTLGQFDVRVDGKLIWSRGENLLARMKPPRLPDISEVVTAIERGKSLTERKTLPIGSKRGAFSPEDAKRFYDRFGSWQDTQFYEKAALEHLVAHSDFQSASAVFELGCGTGKLADYLFKMELADNASYVGVDISTIMIKLATERLANWKGRVELQQADGTIRLPYLDGIFDRFLATYVLDLLSPSAIDHVLSEAHRLLRPNGKLCVISLTEGIKPMSRILSSIWKNVHAFNPRLVGGCRLLRVSTILDRATWKIDHAEVVCAWGICSEIVIASPT